MQRYLPVPFLLALPSVGLAAPSTFSELVYLAITYMNYMSQVLVLATVVVYLGGAAMFLMKKQGGSGAADIRQFLLVGVGILFVMVSVWGILELLSNTISSGGGEFGTGVSETYCNGLDECDL